jgi:sec-independent protein translocase protein TatA
MGPWEIALILAVILIVFGVGKLPQVGGAVGRGLRAFRRGQAGEEAEEEEKEEPEPKRKVTKATKKI